MTRMSLEPVDKVPMTKSDEWTKELLSEELTQMIQTALNEHYKNEHRNFSVRRLANYLLIDVGDSDTDSIAFEVNVRALKYD